MDPMGITHGGWAMTMLDSAMGLSALTTLSPGKICPSHETSVKFVRPILADGQTLHVIGTVISRGRTVITAEGRIEDGDGKLSPMAPRLASLLTSRPKRLRRNHRRWPSYRGGTRQPRHGEPHPLTWAHTPLFRCVCA
jgi:uncharacterized protein (TIGR00369 family)